MGSESDDEWRREFERTYGRPPDDDYFQPVPQTGQTRPHPYTVREALVVGGVVSVSIAVCALLFVIAVPLGLVSLGLLVLLFGVCVVVAPGEFSDTLAMTVLSWTSTNFVLLVAGGVVKFLA